MNNWLIISFYCIRNRIYIFVKNNFTSYMIRGTENIHIDAKNFLIIIDLQFITYNQYSHMSSHHHYYYIKQTNK